jgi:hypothetical protein
MQNNNKKLLGFLYKEEQCSQNNNFSVLEQGRNMMFKTTKLDYFATIFWVLVQGRTMRPKQNKNWVFEKGRMTHPK